LSGKPTPRALAVYSGLLALVALTLLIAVSARTGLEIESPAALLWFVVFTVFTISLGFPSPRFGHTSLDRVAQIAAILIFGPLQAAWINAVASFIWPFLDRRHNPHRGQAMVRALQNTGMFTLIILGAGYLYRITGGQVPLRELGLATVFPLVVMTVAMQAMNELMIAVAAWVDGLGFRQTFSWFSALVELASVPLAVLAALLYNRLEPAVFALFVLVLVMIIFIVNSFARMRSDLENRYGELLAINRVGQAINSSLVVDDLAELIFQECRKLLNFQVFVLGLYDEPARELDFRLHHNEDGRQPRRRTPDDEGLMGWIVTHNRPVLITNWERNNSDLTHLAVIVGRVPQSFIGVPVRFRGRVLGALSVQSFDPESFDEDDLNLMVTFAGQVAVALANARLFEELEDSRNQLEQRVEERTHELESQKQELRELSRNLWETNKQKQRLVEELEEKTRELDRQSKEDSLTGLYNRRYMDERLAAEIQRARRFNHPLSVAMADIDHFKAINDEHTHIVGDFVLRQVADILRHQCRAVDVISRYGGEEFLLCFPETSLDNTLLVCEKIRSAIDEFDWSDVAPGLRMSISIGVASAAPDYDLERVLNEADTRLYDAKRAGRNRVIA
jgi:diguanylate cyclase (GGDEF)-like protein